MNTETIQILVTKTETFKHQSYNSSIVKKAGSFSVFKLYDALKKLQKK